MTLGIFMASDCWISSLQGSPGCRLEEAGEEGIRAACITSRQVWKIGKDNSWWNGIYIKSPNWVEHTGAREDEYRKHLFGKANSASLQNGE